MDDLGKAFELIKKWEGVRLVAYPDPGTGGKPWTIGFGHTSGVNQGDRITMSQAEAFLLDDIHHFVDSIHHVVKVTINNNQLCALASFVFNVGTGAFYHSTMLFELNRGADKVKVAEQFLRWVHAGGHVLEGLVQRRKEEARLFLS